MRFELPAVFACAVLTLGATATPRSPPLRAYASPTAGDARGDRGDLDGMAEAPCPAGALPDNGTCVRAPLPDDGDETEALPVPNAHHERSGRWTVYDQIPRRPDRPADYDAYRYPVPPGLPGGHSVVSGYDLDRPDEVQRRGWRLHAVGHGGVDLPQVKGTSIRMVALEHQQGDADVLYVGPLFGTTVITRHTLREGGRLNDYLVLFGHLEDPAPGLRAGMTLRDGDPVGSVGDTGSPELVHLHLEVRRVREAVDLKKALARGPGELLANAISIVCDPRNVLPLR